MNLRIFDTLEELTRAVARTIRQREHRSVAISGGSTPQPLYELLSTQLREDDPVTWVLVDERYVPRIDPQSNAAMIERTLFANGLPASHRWLSFDTSLNDPAATAAKFAAEWDLSALDIVLLGIGDDGHTASLFPGTPVLTVEDRVASEVYVPRLEQWRVTLTMPVIRAAKLRIVMVTGESKAGIIEDVRKGVPHPIALATQDVETWWFVDRTAAVPSASGGHPARR
jgi:6-phosphogluconolactonase